MESNSTSILVELSGLVNGSADKLSNQWKKYNVDTIRISDTNTLDGTHSPTLSSPWNYVQSNNAQVLHGS